MRTIIIGDIHDEEKAIPEIRETLGEIFQHKADKIIQLGDFYERARPTPAELNFGTEIIKRMKKLYKDVTILAGTGRHEWVNGTNITKYLEHLGVKVPCSYEVITIDNKKCLFGHFMLYESQLAYGSGETGIKDLKDYDIVLLGHQHNPQKLTDKIYHLGSIRYQHWNEVNDKKQFAIIEDGKLSFIPLKTPIPMVDVHSVEELEEINPNTKVRLVFSNYSAFKNSINLIPKYKSLFKEFKLKLDFEKTVEKAEIKKENKSLKIILNEELEKIEDKEIREILKEVLRDENVSKK